jgi:nicotinate-nucleotide pyrophosphorylase (carboxylating)
VNWNTPEIQDLVRIALREDSAQSDITTKLLIDPRWRVEASIVSKGRGVVAGLPLAAKFFRALDPRTQFRPVVRDGAQVRPRQRLAVIKGRARSILSAERPALNALQHLSGIATFTHTQVLKLKGARSKLYDTRKTLPGWRMLQKYAVLCGGGHNHRMSLGDAAMIKENHLKIVRMAKSDWVKGVRQRKSRRGSALVQMEVQTKRDLRDALLLRPQRVLLDNLPRKTLLRMMRTLRRSIPGIEIEFTGGIRPENLRALARLGPDRISMGRLTHSVTAFDCSLDITHVYAP